MNILPKKRWHVRTKENIARVRKDEAKAAEEAKDLERRIKLADQEARTSYLRRKAKERRLETEETILKLEKDTDDCQDVTPNIYNLTSQSTLTSVTASSGHVNFFQELEDGEVATTSNKDREEEEKKEKEQYEKKIGLLTYLGQDSQELTGEKSWWQTLPKDRNVKAEVREETLQQQKHRDLLDPLNSVRKYFGCKGVQNIANHSRNKDEGESKKNKKKKKDSSSTSSEENETYHNKRKKKRTKIKDMKHDDREKRRSKKGKKSHKIKSKKRKRSSTKRHGSSRDSDSSDQANDKKKKIYIHSTKMKEEEKRLKIEKLRRERLEREKKEKSRKNALLYGIKDESVNKELENKSSDRKYNSQFNPQYAKQNKLDASKRYWLQQ